MGNQRFGTNQSLTRKADEEEEDEEEQEEVLAEEEEIGEFSFYFENL